MSQDPTFSCPQTPDLETVLEISTTTQTPTQAPAVSSRTFDDLSGSPPPSQRTASHPPNHTASPPPNHTASPPPSHAALSPRAPPTPSWTLGPQHRGYVRSATSYLIGVPGGPEWDQMLASYVTFESLSSARSVGISIDVRLCVNDTIVGII